MLEAVLIVETVHRNCQNNRSHLEEKWFSAAFSATNAVHPGRKVRRERKRLRGRWGSE
jgi:hypothetical protein